MIRTRDLPEHPEAWRDPEVLEELYVRRSWTLADIVDLFEDLGSDVTTGRLRVVLDQHDIRCGRNNRAPTGGSQAMLWQADSLDEATGGGD
jgi:hypothetical protein